MKKLFGRSKDKTKQAPLTESEQQQPAPIAQLTPAATAAPPFAYPAPQWNPYQMYTPPNPPVPGVPFTPEQLALFTPEQRAQIFQWSNPPPAAASSSLPAPAAVASSPVPDALESATLLKTHANTLLKEESYESALKLYTLALTYTPKSAIILSNRSIAYFCLTPQKLDEAIADVRQAIEIEPDYWKAWARLGQYLIEKGRFREGMIMLEEAIRLGGQSVAANSITRRLLELVRDGDGLPSYSPNVNSTDPLIRALSNRAAHGREGL